MNKIDLKMSSMAAGAIAGIGGTVAMMAMRSFDQRYAPRTVPHTKVDPGAFMMGHLEGVVGMSGRIPGTVEKAAALATHFGYGTLAGAIYGFLRGEQSKRSPLGDGVLIGVIVYSLGHLGWLPLIGLEQPAWKQRFPEIAGELFRHIAYGVTTAAAFGAFNAGR